ncbi:hypothetical protein EYR40_010943 [Pleurotus pulmonarius]|nr:hypothetical protein EYR40_010943 [Pleurotus pulmonarius]
MEAKLKQWYNNHTCVNANSRQVLNLNQGKRSKRPAAFQTFSSLYYDGEKKDTILPKEEKRFHDIVEEEWSSHCKENKLYDAKGRPAKMPVSFLNKIAKSVFENQPSEIQEEVANHPLQHPATKKDDEGEGEENADLTAAR